MAHHIWERIGRMGKCLLILFIQIFLYHCLLSDPCCRAGEEEKEKSWPNENMPSPLQSTFIFWMEGVKLFTKNHLWCCDAFPGVASEEFIEMKSYLFSFSIPCLHSTTQEIANHSKASIIYTFFVWNKAALNTMGFLNRHAPCSLELRTSGNVAETINVSKKWFPMKLFGWVQWSSLADL